MKHFFEKTISILLVFVLLTGFAPFQWNGHAEDVAIAINSIEDFPSYESSAEENGTVTLTFGTGNYVFNSTIELEEGKNYVISASEPDVCFSHGAFSGEMFFVPESSSLTVLGVENDPASP